MNTRYAFDEGQVAAVGVLSDEFERANAGLADALGVDHQGHDQGAPSLAHYTLGWQLSVGRQRSRKHYGLIEYSQRFELAQ
jgi:hypothetical protein